MFTKYATYRNKYATLHYCGKSKIQHHWWNVFLIGTPEGVIFDIAIFPVEVVHRTNKKLVIKGEEKEIFFRVKNK